MNTPSPHQVLTLSKTLANSLDIPALKRYVYASTGEQLFVAYVTENQTRRAMVDELLTVLKNEGTICLFLGVVHGNLPGRPDIRQMIEEMCPDVGDAIIDKVVAVSAQIAGHPQKDPPTNALAPGLQRNVRPYLKYLDIRVWPARILEIERRVCRLEYNETALGTGFLVGPDTVLTNWHVVEDAVTANKLQEVKFRFDHVKLPDDSVQGGELVGLAAAGCLDTSPYGQGERVNKPDDPPPTADELDYALLRLATPVGEQAIGGAKRGWFVLPSKPQPLPENSPLLIAQHPSNEPMKLGLDTDSVIGRTADGRRLRYKTTTDPGSSGSPCFTMDCDIVALHHYGDPNWKKPLFNQGVPIELVRQRIEAKHLGHHLGA